MRVSGAFDKQKLDLLLCFGKHRARADADELARDAELFRPDVYVQETADMPAAERIARIRSVNRDLERGRKHAEAGRRVLAEAGLSGAGYEREFSAEKRRVLLDQPGARFYAIEDDAPHELVVRHYKAVNLIGRGGMGEV